MFVSPEEIKSSGQKIVNIDTMNYYQIMKLVDTDFNNYFSDRQINQKNYIQYLQTLLRQKKPKLLQIAFEKMELYDIKPNCTCYMFLIESYGQSKQLFKAEATLDNALEIYGWNIYLVNSMLYVYKYLKIYKRAINLFQQAKLKGLKPDIVSYTNLIMLCNRKQMNEKCWELYEQAKKDDIEIDDFLMGVMIGICGDTQDSEKAIKLWDEMIKLPEIRLNALHYSSLMKALSSRIDYCERALEIYDEMKFKKIQPSRETFLYGLKAASKLGNIAAAYELALELRNFSYKINSQISYYLLQTYAKALKNPMLPTQLKERYFKDSWTIINSLIDRKQLNPSNLNALLEVHMSYNKILEAEEIVLPLFDTIKLQRNSKTYEIFFLNFHNKREIQSIFNLYNKLTATNQKLISRVSLDIVLKSYFAVKDINKIIEILDTFIEIKKSPDNTTLIEMSKSKNIPDAILFRMNKFPFILKRNNRSRRVYGEHVDLIHIAGNVRSKKKQKQLQQQELRNNHSELQEEIEENLDKVYLADHDKPDDIDDEDFEDFDENMKFSDYQKSLDQIEQLENSDYEYSDEDED